MVREDWEVDGCHVLCRRLPPDPLFVVVRLGNSGVVVSPEVTASDARDLLEACGYTAGHIEELLNEACLTLRRMKLPGSGGSEPA